MIVSLALRTGLRVGEIAALQSVIFTLVAAMPLIWSCDVAKVIVNRHLLQWRTDQALKKLH